MARLLPMNMCLNINFGKNFFNNLPDSVRNYKKEMTFADPFITPSMPLRHIYNGTNATKSAKKVNEITISS
jgi:hypothetical protein